MRTEWEVHEGERVIQAMEAVEARDEAQRLAREEAERFAREEAERLAREEAAAAGGGASANPLGGLHGMFTSMQFFLQIFSSKKLIISLTNVGFSNRIKFNIVNVDYFCIPNFFP